MKCNWTKTLSLLSLLPVISSNYIIIIITTFRLGIKLYIPIYDNDKHMQSHSKTEMFSQHMNHTRILIPSSPSLEMAVISITKNNDRFYICLWNKWATYLQSNSKLSLRIGSYNQHKTNEIYFLLKLMEHTHTTNPKLSFTKIPTAASIISLQANESHLNTNFKLSFTKKSHLPPIQQTTTSI